MRSTHCCSDVPRMATCEDEKQKQSKYLTETPVNSPLEISHSVTFLYDNVEKIDSNEDQHQRLFKIYHRFFALKGILGRGKYGKVYSCEEVDPKSVSVYDEKGTNNNKPLYAKYPRNRVAIKRSHHSECFRTEYNVLLRSGQHPFLLTMFEGVNLADYQLLLMEYVKGVDLFTLAFRLLDRAMSAAETWFYLAECAEGIAHLHQRGIVHQDIKSDNILITARGHVKIADFGLAIYKLPLGEKTPGQLISQSRHMPPEIVLSDPRSKDPSDNLDVWHAVDWFSLGVMAYRLLHQTYPYEGKSKEALNVSYQNASIKFKARVGKEPPTEMQKLIIGLLHTNPQKRLGGDGVRGHKDVLWHAGIRNHPRLRDSENIGELRRRIKHGYLNPPFRFTQEENKVQTEIRRAEKLTKLKKNNVKTADRSVQNENSSKDEADILPIVLEA